MEKRIKLPVIPKSFGEAELNFIWNYAKADEEEKKKIKKFLHNIIDDGKRTQDYKKIMWELDLGMRGKEMDLEEEIVDLMETLCDQIFSAACEIYKKAMFEYYENGKCISEVAKELEQPEARIAMIIERNV